jgi:hypothetical protein
MIFNNRVKYALVIYLLFILIVLLTKPKFMFKKNGEFKAFGTGRNKTVFPFWLLIFVAIVISYYLANLMILIKR